MTDFVGDLRTTKANIGPRNESKINQIENVKASLHEPCGYCHSYHQGPYIGDEVSGPHVADGEKPQPLICL